MSISLLLQCRFCFSSTSSSGLLRSLLLRRRLRLACLLGLLRLLLDGLERLGEDRLELLVLDLVLGLDSLGRVEDGRVRELDDARLGHCEGDEDLRGEVGGPVERERLVGLQEA
jgi:hypothetical protein